MFHILISVPNCPRSPHPFNFLHSLASKYSYRNILLRGSLPSQSFLFSSHLMCVRNDHLTIPTVAIACGSPLFFSAIITVLLNYLQLFSFDAAVAVVFSSLFLLFSLVHHSSRYLRVSLKQVFPKSHIVFCNTFFLCKDTTLSLVHSHSSSRCFLFCPRSNTISLLSTSPLQLKMQIV